MQSETVQIYAKTLTFNVITRYDPNIQQLLYHAPHAQLYSYSPTTKEWSKLDTAGTLALYSRDTHSSTHQANKDDIYTHGIIVFNKGGIDCFSLGLLSSADSHRYGISEVKSELMGDYIMVKNLLGEVFGLWVPDEEERKVLAGLIANILGN